MAYKYGEQRCHVFTEDGVAMLLAIRDRARALLDTAGAVQMQPLITAAGGGDSWHMLACVDFLCERNELQEVTRGDVAGQHRVFVRGSAWREA